MPLVANIAFASRFTAKLNSGAAASRPSSPAGVGDTYFATDTNVLSLANAAGTGWTTFSLNNIGSVDPVNYLLLDGSRAMTGQLQMAANAIRMTQIATPSSPPSTNFLIYPKSDGKLYILNSSGVEAQVGGGSASSVTFAGVRLSASSALSQTTDATWADIPFGSGTKTYDSNNYHDTVTNNARMTVPSGKAGKYHITGQVRAGESVPETQFGKIGLQIELNGTTSIAESSIRFDTASDLALEVSTDYSLSVGDYVKLRFKKNTGNGTTAIITYDARFMMHLIGV
jgi:hypothetical protein